MMSDNLPGDQDKTEKNVYKSVVYTVDEQGRYARTTRFSCEPEDMALELTWEHINENIQQIKNRVIAGELSPLAYYMEKCQFTLRRLSNDTGLAKRKIKKHLSPKAFSTLDRETLLIYADIFKITVEQLLKPLY
jgi:hypothetical protein